MATTEITKILFRRGTSDDRYDLEALGGLAQGEPGFTSAGGGTYGSAGSTQPYNQASAFLLPDDSTQHAPGDASHGGSARSGGGDFFIGGSGTADIFIGGTSAERHWLRYFVSKYGTSFNHPDQFIDGPLIVGEAGRTATGTRAQNYETHVWNVQFWGENGDTSWNAQTGQFNVTSSTALAVPSGATADRPVAGTSGTLGTRRLGHIRWNTTTGKYEGWNGNHWGSLGRPEDADQDTFVRAESAYGADNDQVEIFTNGTNRATIGNTTMTVEVDTTINTTGYLEIPNGSTAQRPGTPQQGMIRYNIDNNVDTFEGYNGTTWQTFGGGVLADRDNQTYITCSQGDPVWSNGTGETLGTTGMIKFVVGTGTPRTATLAGYFDNGRNFFVRQDIVAYQSSDTRQKDNVRLIENSIEKVKMLRGVEFDWNDKGPAWVGNNRNDIGLLAQEVEAVIPQAVVDRDDGFKAVDYKKVIPLLVESIKELTARVEELESRQ